MKHYLKVFILFILLNYCVMISSISNESFYVLRNILIPYDYENSKVIILNLIINYALIFIFVINIIKTYSELFSMISYIRSRCNENKVYILFLIRPLKQIVILLLIKFIVDLLFGPIYQYSDIVIIIKFYILYALTFLIWMLAIYFLYLIKLEEKKYTFLYC